MAVALRKINKSYGLDMTDLIILDDVAQRKRKGQVTIMEIVETSEAASPATVHARIKNMCASMVLKKQLDETNLRLRTLDFGPTYHQMVEEVGLV
jgi:hypothetical protein